MIRVIVLAAAALYLLINVISKLNAPVPAVLLRDHFYGLVYRTQVSAPSAFNGTFTGKNTGLGRSGTYNGTFLGVCSNERTTGNFNGQYSGIFKLLGSSGLYKGVFGGVFDIWKRQWAYFGKASVRFEVDYNGTYEDQGVLGKAVGTYTLKVSPKGFTLKERGNVNLQIGNVPVAGIFESTFNGLKASAKFKGTVDGKNVRLGGHLFYPDMTKLVANEGSYAVTKDNTTTVGTFRSQEIVPMN